jgi:hypothetical protein
MRNAVVQLAAHRTAGEEKQVLRTAVRQLERADLYLGAVASIDLGDRDLEGSLRKLRSALALLLGEIREKRLRLSE